MEEKNIKGISSQHTPPLEVQPTVQGLPGIMWTPEPSVELGLPPLIPHAAKRTGTLPDSWHYFTHTGPFKVFLPQARPPRGAVCSEDLYSWSICQSVVRAGGLKPGWILLCKTATISELGVPKRLLWRGKTELGCARRQDEKPMPSSLQEWLWH